VILIESSNNPKAHNKKEGAVGLMQLRPIVYNKICGMTEQEAFDPVKNVACGSIYLKHLIKRFNGNLGRALQYYNSGHRGNIVYIEKLRRHLNEELVCLNQ
jgi:soluble lytic murein transglycosylase-like protein